MDAFSTAYPKPVTSLPARIALDYGDDNRATLTLLDLEHIRNAFVQRRAVRLIDPPGRHDGLRALQVGCLYHIRAGAYARLQIWALTSKFITQPPKVLLAYLPPQVQAQMIPR